MAKGNGEKYLMENAASPDHKVKVDAQKFLAMKTAVLAALPDEAPGITPAELRQRIVSTLSQEHFPYGEKAGWWMKGVQLDLECKGFIARGSTKPVKIFALRPQEITK